MIFDVIKNFVIKAKKVLLKQNELNTGLRFMLVVYFCAKMLKKEEKAKK